MIVNMEIHFFPTIIQIYNCIMRYMNRSVSQNCTFVIGLVSDVYTDPTVSKVLERE